MAEEGAKDYELRELLEVIFYAILLNVAERLGVLAQGSALNLHGDRIFKARFRTRAAPEESSGVGLQEESSGVELEGEGSAGAGAASPSDDDKQGRKWYNRREGKTKNDWYAYFPFHHGVSSPLQHRGDGRPCEGILIWRWRRATCPPHPLSKDFYVLCPRFSLPEAEEAAASFELPEMVQAIFYAMLLNEAVELRVVHGFMTEGLRSALVGLRWSSFEAAEYIRDHFRWLLRDPSAPGLRPLLSDYHGLCLHFDLGVAMQYARDSNTPEMVQIIFYAMVVDDATKLGLLHRLTMDCVMWAMRKLDWGPVEAWLGDNGRRLRRA
ncbi:hypothetical protein Cgig2_017381 [Carnegiea gigantea]|uniref:Uncharacterized protein n=1 Tax=Carnegiea gigantea TaxID=171969 RepID=A0A9Q1GSI0_9CARY|nr:hypothetical protein Cgig2_017381 [Carnegiea gigantea]